MNRQCNTGVGVITFSQVAQHQVYQYQVASVMYQVHLSNI